MSVTHVVLFEFKATASPDVVNASCARLLKLARDCLHPTTMQPYIAIKGGKDNSVKPLQNGATHAFVFEFPSVADRNYFMNEDQAHIEVHRLVEPIVDKVTVVDFTPGEF